MFRLFVKPDITYRNFYPSREAKILDQCKGKKVLHIGACDWPYTKDKLGNNNLLYQNIDRVCDEQLGVDLDKDSIKYLNELNIFNKSKFI